VTVPVLGVEPFGWGDLPRCMGDDVAVDGLGGRLGGRASVDESVGFEVEEESWRGVEIVCGREGRPCRSGCPGLAE
jgi:hypothetical protein